MTAQKPLRLMLYDDTCRGRRFLPGLTHSWIVGGFLYRLLGRIDRVFGARSWAEGLQWLASVEEHRPVAEIQFWGHGKWGRAKIADDVLDVGALRSEHPYYSTLAAIGDRLVGPQALWWFRTCETFGCEVGHEFARQWTQFFDCRAAGHTYIIGPWQSGLHVLGPGEEPDWSLQEGLAQGTPKDPKKALWSRPGELNTITCLHNGHPGLRD